MPPSPARGAPAPSPSHSPQFFITIATEPPALPPRLGLSSDTPGSPWDQGPCPGGSAHATPRFVPNLGALLPPPKSKELTSICVTFGERPHPPPNVGTTADAALSERGLRPIVQKKKRCRGPSSADFLKSREGKGPKLTQILPSGAPHSPEEQRLETSLCFCPIPLHPHPSLASRSGHLLFPQPHPTSKRSNPAPTFWVRAPGGRLFAESLTQRWHRASHKSPYRSHRPPWTLLGFG